MKNLRSYSLRVRAIIKNSNDEVLLIKKSINSNPFWTVPGGGVYPDEPLEEALKREVLEEVGITICSGNLICIREIIINQVFRGYEFFFLAEFVNGDICVDNANESSPTLCAKWLHLGLVTVSDLRPDFLSEVIVRPPEHSLVESYNYSLRKYVNDFGGLPELDDSLELVHVMFKPDALENNLVQSIVDDLISLGGITVDKFDHFLTKTELRAIYSDVTDNKIIDLIDDYLVGKKTTHFVFVGQKGIHEVFNKAKGKSGNQGYGIRGKYITKYINLSPADWEDWLRGRHKNQEALDKEMFCHNLIHIASDQDASRRGLDIIYKTS